MTRILGPQAYSSEDGLAAEHAAQEAGASAYWAGNARDTGVAARKGQHWLYGWDKAAQEAAQLLQGEGNIIKRHRVIRDALQAAEAAIRGLRHVKEPAGARIRADGALLQIEGALRELGEPRAGKG